MRQQARLVDNLVVLQKACLEHSSAVCSAMRPVLGAQLWSSRTRDRHLCAHRKEEAINRSLHKQSIELVMVMVMGEG